MQEQIPTEALLEASSGFNYHYTSQELHEKHILAIMCFLCLRRCKCLLWVETSVSSRRRWKEGTPRTERSINTNQRPQWSSAGDHEYSYKSSFKYSRWLSKYFVSISEVVSQGVDRFIERRFCSKWASLGKDRRRHPKINRNHSPRTRNTLALFLWSGPHLEDNLRSEVALRKREQLKVEVSESHVGCDWVTFLISL